MDIKYMKRALELAENGVGYVNPNPMVGCVIVRNGKIIGEGYHRVYGGNHAEVEALIAANEDAVGSTMYVNLEPCSHYGKTPPCTSSIIKNGIKKVVIAMLDPNPLVSGSGVKVLKDHGIEVVTGALEAEAMKLNEVFVKYIVTKLPFCLMKSAMSMDGKIATKFSDSKWITSNRSREYVHRLRHRYSSIMVGINTVLADNPLLTVRLKDFNGKNPIRVIVDSRCRLPLDASVVKKAFDTRTIVATTEKADLKKIKLLEEKNVEVLILSDIDSKVDLNALMKKLGEMGIDSVLLEGGGALNYSALNSGIVDKVNFFIAPKIIGGELSKTPVEGAGVPLVKHSYLVSDMVSHSFGQDIMLEGYVVQKG